MNTEDFANKIKAKYPQYADMDNTELVNKIVTKYPVYKQSLVNESESPSVAPLKGAQAPGIVRGLGKSALDLVQGVGELGQNVLQQTAGRVVEKITGVPKEEMGAKVFEQGTEQFNQIQDATKAEGTGEQVGKFVGDVAQFVIPATQVGKVQKGASLASRIVGQAVSDTGVQALKEGELNKDVAETAIFSLAFPGVVEGGKAGIKKILGDSNSAGRIIDSLIKPAKKELAYGKNPGKAIAEEGLVANSLDDLGEKVKNVIKQKSDEYINEIRKSGISNIDVSGAFNPIDDAISTAVKQNNQTLVNRLNSIKVALTQNLDSVIDESGNQIIKSTGSKNLQSLTPEDIVNIKKEIGEMTMFTGNPTDDKLVNSALKKIYGNVKGKIDEAVPGSSKLSEKIASLISADSAIANRAAVLQRQNVGNFTGKVLGGAGALASIFTANPVPALIGLGAGGIENALGTPAFKTRFAKFLSGATAKQKEQIYTAMPTLRAIINRELGND